MAAAPQEATRNEEPLEHLSTPRYHGMPWHGQGPRRRHGSRFPSQRGAGCRACWLAAKRHQLRPRRPVSQSEMLAGLPGLAQGCDSVRGALPRSRCQLADLSMSPGGEPEPSRPSAALSQAPVGSFVPALSQWPMSPSPLMSMTWSCTTS